MTRTTCALALTATLVACSTAAPKPAGESPAPTAAAGPPAALSRAAPDRLAAPPASAPAPTAAGAAEKSEPSAAAKPEDDGRPGEKAQYSLYMLALSWAPNFCATHQQKEQCTSMPGTFAAKHLTIHGLWPNYSDKEAVGQPHPWPEFCSPYDACSKETPALCNPPAGTVPADMKTYGPGYVTDEDFLANHEWPKHGSCTGLTAKAYFSQAINALWALPGDHGTPKKLADAIGKKIKATALRAAFEHPESVVLSCDAKCNLSQVGICLASGADGLPNGRTACPKNVTNSSYDNGCFIKNRCKDISVQEAGASPQPSHECKSPAQGPACEDDAFCKKEGFLRCAKSGCCTQVPK